MMVDLTDKLLLLIEDHTTNLKPTSHYDKTTEHDIRLLA